ncbi:MAG: PhnD/SsuA/transferrin family substrate-binding protein [Mesorhizobium sp.]
MTQRDTSYIAALPMYDWPERRAEVDAQWAGIRDRLRAAGIDAPDALTRDFDDLHELWRSPSLLFAQTCWGPMEQGLADQVQVVGQPSYDGIEGGQGEFYSSALVMQRGVKGLGFTSPIEREVAPRSGAGGGDAAARHGGHPTPELRADLLPLDLLRNARFAYNGPDSMSGLIGLSRDLAAAGESLDIFSERIQTGGHRLSIQAVAQGIADVAAIDCMSWHLAQQYEPAARDLCVVGWTSPRKGLPFITAKSTPPDVVAALRSIIFV